MTMIGKSIGFNLFMFNKWEKDYQEGIELSLDGARQKYLPIWNVSFNTSFWMQ
jgi:hypothetical protein